jgi:hypothetical protein
MGPMNPAIVSTTIMAVIALIVCVGLVGVAAYERWK